MSTRRRDRVKRQNGSESSSVPLLLVSGGVRGPDLFGRMHAPPVHAAKLVGRSDEPHGEQERYGGRCIEGRRKAQIEMNRAAR